MPAMENPTQFVEWLRSVAPYIHAFRGKTFVIAFGGKAVESEFAETLADVMARRILLAFEPGHGLAGADRAAAILGERLGWNTAKIKAEVDGYKRWLDHLRIPYEPVAKTKGK